MLSPSCSVVAPMRSSMASQRLLSGVSRATRMWRPVLMRAAALAGQQHRQVVVLVAVAVADGAAVGDHAVVEQRAVAFVDRLELAEEVGELLDVVGVDRANLGLQLGLVLVVRDRVMAFVDADHRVFLVAAFAAEHERGDARHVGLEGEDQQVADQVEVLGQVGGQLFGLLRAVGQLRRAAAFRRGRCALRARGRSTGTGRASGGRRRRACCSSEWASSSTASSTLARRRPRFRRSGSFGLIGEEAVEDELGVDLGRQRRGRIAPGERVLIDAGVAAVAVAGAAEFFDAQLQRGEAGVVAERLGGDLVGRDAGAEIRAGRLAGLRAGEERRRGAGMVAGAVAVGRALSQVRPLRTSTSSLDAAPAAAGSAGSSKSVPSLAGVQSSMWQPLGT